MRLPAKGGGTTLRDSTTSIPSYVYQIFPEIRFDAASGTTISTYQRYYIGVISLAWSPDGRRIASGDDEDTARVWKAP